VVGGSMALRLHGDGSAAYTRSIEPVPMTPDCYPEVMDKRWPTHGQSCTGRFTGVGNRRWSEVRFLERTTGFEPATPTVARKRGGWASSSDLW
jgi:hypothetical protein